MCRVLVHEFPRTFEAQGGVRVQGNAPVDEPGIVDAACGA